jgi:hypothetical protein
MESKQRKVTDYMNEGENYPFSESAVKELNGWMDE